MRQFAMRRLIISAVVLGAGFPAHAQAPDVAFKAALAEAETTNKRAGELRNQWTVTFSALTAARKAAEAGEFDKATKLAQDAKALAEASVAQSLREKDAWRDSELR